MKQRVQKHHAAIELPRNLVRSPPPSSISTSKVYPFLIYVHPTRCSDQDMLRDHLSNPTLEPLRRSNCGWFTNLTRGCKHFDRQLDERKSGWQGRFKHFQKFITRLASSFAQAPDFPTVRPGYLSILTINLLTCRIRFVQVFKQSVQGVLLKIPRAVRVLAHAVPAHSRTKDSACWYRGKEREHREGVWPLSGSPICSVAQTFARNNDDTTVQISPRHDGRSVFVLYWAQIIPIHQYMARHKLTTLEKYPPVDSR